MLVADACRTLIAGPGPAIYIYIDHGLIEEPCNYFFHCKSPELGSTFINLDKKKSLGYRKSYPWFCVCFFVQSPTSELIFWKIYIHVLAIADSTFSFSFFNFAFIWKLKDNRKKGWEAKLIKSEDLGGSTWPKHSILTVHVVLHGVLHGLSLDVGHQW